MRWPYRVLDRHAGKITIYGWSTRSDRLGRPDAQRLSGGRQRSGVASTTTRLKITVIADGNGVVSHAGSRLLADLADRTTLTGRSSPMAERRLSAL